MTQMFDNIYKCVHYSDKGANGLALLAGSLIQENLDKFPGRYKIARKVKRTVALSDNSLETCSVLFGPDQAFVLNGLIGVPIVTVIDTTGDQLLAVSQLKMRAGGLLPTGFFSRAGMAVIGAILRKELIVKGLVAHPITVLRVIALVSVE
ncbi:hypothetical protein JCM9803A_02820 [Rhodococcus erythropolis]